MAAKSGGPTANIVGGASLDQLHIIDDFGEATLTALAGRIERSRTAEHLIYRESELDEVWRLLEGAIRDIDADGGPGERAAVLKSLRAIVTQAHDLVGVEGDAAKAASELRGSLVLARSWTTAQR